MVRSKSGTGESKAPSSVAAPLGRSIATRTEAAAAARRAARRAPHRAAGSARCRTRRRSARAPATASAERLDRPGPCRARRLRRRALRFAGRGDPHLDPALAQARARSHSRRRHYCPARTAPAPASARRSARSPPPRRGRRAPSKSRRWFRPRSPPSSAARISSAVRMRARSSPDPWRASRKRSSPIATSIRRSSDHRDLRRLRAVRRDHAAPVGDDAQAAEAAVGLAHGEGDALRPLLTLEGAGALELRVRRRSCSRCGCLAAPSVQANRPLHPPRASAHRRSRRGSARKGSGPALHLARFWRGGAALSRQKKAGPSRYATARPDGAAAPARWRQGPRANVGANRRLDSSAAASKPRAITKSCGSPWLTGGRKLCRDGISGSAKTGLIVHQARMRARHCGSRGRRASSRSLEEPEAGRARAGHAGDAGAGQRIEHRADLGHDGIAGA